MTQTLRKPGWSISKTFMLLMYSFLFLDWYLLPLQSQAENLRMTPVVSAVKKVSPAVVNISTEAIVSSNPFMSFDPFTDDFMVVTSSEASNGQCRLTIQRWDGAAWGDLTLLNNTGYTYESFAVNYDRMGPDTTAPSAVSNLTALAGNSDGSITLKWTDPGDNGVSGNVSGGTYIIKAATYCITSSNFGSITHNLFYT